MSPTAIRQVRAWEALDSRGKPTVACSIRLAGGGLGEVRIPSGASTSAYEVHELRDGGSRYGGFGVQRAVENLNRVLAPAVIGLDGANQGVVDHTLEAIDESPGLSNVGGNAVLAVSVAAAVAAADAISVPLYHALAPSGAPLLPMPMVNIVSGGAHAGGAVDIQDVMVIPVGASSFSQALEWCWRVRTATAEVAAQHGLPTALVADEGGFGPPLRTNREALELVALGIERAGLTPAEEVAMAVDVAASQLVTAHQYRFAAEGRTLDASQLVDELAGWCADFPIVSIEDPLGEEDWVSWAGATQHFSDIQLVGDDLFATHLDRLERAISRNIANAILIKPNQAGTLSAAAATLRRAQQAGYATILSARSGDTEDSWLADLAVGWRSGQIKVGSLTRSERTAKWNRLLAIEAELGAAATFAGRQALACSLHK